MCPQVVMVVRSGAPDRRQGTGFSKERWIRRRLRKILLRQWKRPYPPSRKLTVYSYPVVQDILRVLVFSTPVFLLAQLIALIILIRRVAFCRDDRELAVRRFARWSLLLGVAVAPVVMLMVSTASAGGYQGERGGWFYHQHSGLAGSAMVPVYLAGSIIVGRGILNDGYRRHSATHLSVLTTLMVICWWYAFATAFLKMGDDFSSDMSATAWIPALAAVNYGLLITHTRRHGEIDSVFNRAIGAWFGALALTLIARVPLAMRIYDALPPEAPAGYGDCFVAGAATRGHRGFVGSRYDARLDRTVNQQWRTLRAFENLLQHRRPGLHGRLRNRYNRIGPVVAAWIRSPLAADIAYVALKPVEWLAWIYLVCHR